MPFCSTRALAVSLGLSVFAFSAPAADIGVVEEIIAKVNGDIITRTELDRSRKQLEADAKQRGASPAEVQERMKNILAERIDQLLLVQRGKELSINVDPEVSKYIADLQRQSGIADSEKFQSYVREQTGQTFEDWRQEVRNGYLTRRVIGQEVTRNVQIPRAELQKYYEEHKTEFVREESVYLRELLVSTENKDEAGIKAAELRAKDIVARARKGEKFDDLVRDYSDAASKKEMGELGFFKRGELGRQIENMVFSMERNSVTDPIRVEKGFLILRVEERFKPGQATFEEVEQEITNRLYQPRMQPAIRTYLTKLRQDAFLEIKDGYTDTQAAPGKSTKWSDPAQLKPETVTREEVANQKRRRRLLGIVPIPGTSTTGGTSKSQ
jgi:peptidyl-prolyl cis-trans isomerase SurA